MDLMYLNIAVDDVSSSDGQSQNFDVMATSNMGSRK